MGDDPLTDSATSPLTYAEAGVDVAAGERAVELIKPLVESTRRPEVIGGIGGFGGLFALDDHRTLVAATDGVGTKLELARLTNKLDTVGIDLVAMCVDDLVCQGAEPLFFLDYIVTEKLDPEQIATIVSGIADGCRHANVALLGGEMAEHPGVMFPGSFDLAGFAVGVVDTKRRLPGAQPHDTLVGLPSPGLRSNGYSLVRAVIEQQGLDLDAPAWPGADMSLKDELLRPSVIYAPAVKKLLNEATIHGVAHITGGGLPGNIPRMLSPGTTAVIDWGSWPVPRIFQELIWHGRIERPEEVFNMGIGMVIATPEPAAIPEGIVIGRVQQT